MVKLNKQSLRKELLLKRSELSPEFILENSKKIAENLINLSIYQKSANIMLYVATQDEVQTQEIIKSAQKDKKRIFIPLIIRKDNALLPSLVTDFEEELVQGVLGIYQPKKEFYRIYPPSTLEMVIVPGVAFTIHGHRLGRGGGYYDRFLSQLEGQIYSIALSFEMQIFDEIPFDVQDMPVDYIITEKRVIRIRE